MRWYSPKTLDPERLYEYFEKSAFGKLRRINHYSVLPDLMTISGLIYPIRVKKKRVPR